MKRSESDGGFNLVELVIVVAILGVIVSIAIVTYAYAIDNSFRIACESNQRILTEAGAVFQADNGYPPDEMEDLRDYASTFDVVKTCPSDHDVLLEWDTDEEEAVCPLHP